MLPIELDGEQWDVPAETVGVGVHDHADIWRCPRCGATWVADVPEWCWWCCRAWVAQQRAQRRIDLMAPEWDHEVRGWVTRLTVAIAAGRVTPEEAARAVARHNRGRLRDAGARDVPNRQTGSGPRR